MPAKVLDTEIIKCKYCDKIYIHKIYRKGSNSRCPYCGRINEKKKCNISRPGMLKSRILKECANPDCDDGTGRPYLFWAEKATDKFCSKECYKMVERKKGVIRGKEWRKQHPERTKEINRNYNRKRRKEKDKKELKYYQNDFWKKWNQKEEKKAMIEYDEYKGNKMIVLKRTEDDEYPFKFGIRKAELIIENFEAIKEFVEKNSNQNY